MLPSLSTALGLPFQIMKDGVETPATAEQITLDYSRVMSMPSGRRAQYYECPTSVFLDDMEIDALLKKVVEANDSLLAKFYPTYVAWPDAAKLAVLDMCYNLGAQHLERTYPAMDGFLNQTPPNFTAAAGECGRDVVDPKFAARNDWTKQQFLEAA
jgi:hypothetical protein